MAETRENFLIANDFTAKWEGGLSDHPADTGGLTAYGASLTFVQGIAATRDGREFLRSIGVHPPVTRETMREEVTPERARAMFKREFWDSLRLDDYPFAVALILYDAAVNCGCAQSVKLAQRGYNACVGPYGDRLDEDGKAGPLTRKALCVNATPAALTAMLDARQRFYEELAARKPSQAVFLEGWTNRVKDLRAFLRREGAI